jgi:hypothetical protein
LAQQTAEQKAREEEQRRRDEVFEQQRIHDAKLALYLENKIEEVTYFCNRTLEIIPIT